MTAMQAHMSVHRRSQPAEHFGEVLAKFVAELQRSLFDPYRPERHYMRGPGPKCRERCEKAGTNRDR